MVTTPEVSAIRDADRIIGLLEANDIHKIDLVIDTPTQGNGDKTRDGFLIRRNAIETGVYCITAMDTANALARSLETAMDTLTPVDIAKVKNL